MKKLFNHLIGKYIPYRQQYLSAKCMPSALHCLLLMSFIIAITNNVVAQTKSITVEGAIAIALKNNTELKSKELNFKSAQKMQLAAFELPQTNINFQYGQNEGFADNDAIQFSQTLPFPSVFSAKK